MKIIFIIFILLFSLDQSSLSAADTVQQKKSKEIKAMPKTIQEVQEKYTNSIMAIAGVECIGIGKKKDKDCIVIFVSKTTKEMKKKIPKELGGYPVKIEVTGKFHALPKK